MSEQVGKVNPVVYALFKGFFLALSLLPFWVLYRISDLLFLLTYYLVGYRRKVVFHNLSLAFPEKSQKERKQIARKFYLHFCDLLVEALKSVSLSAGELKQRMTLLNPEIIKEIAQEGKGTLILASHYGNFEWTNSCIDYYSQEIQCYSIYQRLQNPYAERLITEIRSRWGTNLIDKQEAFRKTLVLTKSLCMIGFMSDQSPSRRPVLYFSRFLGQPSAMHEGAAMLAVGRNLPAYFTEIKRQKRGHYTCRLIRIPTDQFSSSKDIHGFTDYYAQLLETNIREEPAFWLWSHRRWKHVPREGDMLSPLLEKA